MNKCRSWLALLPYIAVIGILLLLISSRFTSNAKSFTYNEFLNKADKIEFKSAEMSMGTTVIDISGTYMEKGKEVGFMVSVPNTESNVENIDKNLSEE